MSFETIRWSLLGKSTSVLPNTMVYSRRWMAMFLVGGMIIGVVFLYVEYPYFLPGLLLGLVSGEIWIRHRYGDGALIAAIVATFLIAFGRRVVLSERRGLLDERERRLASRAGIFAINIWLDREGRFHRELYFLRRSAAVRFKLSYVPADPLS